ncbi:MAG: acyl-CoA dehydrogenase family protein [Gaiellales bacterium]|jgi:acyl-CoA dehydrogenase|nr:acyl-CoA dehydrogenase family protein [Gaiellales bacterium]
MAELAPYIPDLTDEQREIQQLAREFARREIRPVAAEVDEKDTYCPVEVVHRAAEVGLTSYMLPEEVGGGGIADVLTGCIVQEELNWGCAGIGNLVTSGAFFARPVLEVGTDEQKERWLTPLCGERPPLTALASTEPGVGSDTAAMTTSAVRDGDSWVLNGQKTWISNGGVAEFYVVFATVAPGTGSKGVTAFLLEKGDQGLSFGEPMRKVGQRAIINTELFLHDCRIPADRLLGEEGKGFYSLMHTFDESRVHLAASAVGIARAAFEYAVEYAKTREAFGRPIGQHQAVGFRLADMATRIDAARLLTHRAARLMDEGKHVPAEAAMAKLFASETATWVTWAAVQTLGGWGYSREYPVEKWSRDARLEEIEEGTSDIQRLIISRGLLRS